jgi:hypothetical protein
MVLTEREYQAWWDVINVVIPQVVRTGKTREGLALMADVLEWGAAQCRKALEEENDGQAVA